LQELTSQNEEIRKQDAVVRGRVSAMESGQLVLATGSDLEEALRANDRAALELERARADGLLGEFRTLHTYLWSSDLQQQNLRFLTQRPELETTTLDLLEAHGFESEAFAGFLDDARTSVPLSFDDLVASPLRDMVRNFVVQTDRGVAVITFVRDVRDAATLQRRLAELPGVLYFDQADLLDRAYQQFRQRTVELVLVGALVVVLVLFVTYRRLRLTMAAFLPAMVGSAATLALIAHLGEPLNLFHVLSCVLVLSMGEDYGVFLVDTARGPTLEHDAGSALASIALAGSSTALSFGALAFSSEPALRAIGQTVGLGVIACFVLAPVALILTGANARPMAPKRPA
jgi:predicted exporter